MIRHLVSLHWLQLRVVRQLCRYYQDAMTSCRPSRRTSLPSFGGTQRSLVLFAPRRTSAPPRPGVGDPVSPAGNSLRNRQDLPSSWGIPIVRLHMFSRRRQDCWHQTIKCRSVALASGIAKAPTKGLSTLNSMAFGLAVYASPDELPTFDVRLASGRWSVSTRRAFHPQDSCERFQICFLHFTLLSQACLAQSTRP